MLKKLSANLLVNVAVGTLIAGTSSIYFLNNYKQRKVKGFSFYKVHFYNYNKIKTIKKN